MLIKKKLELKKKHAIKVLLWLRIQIVHVKTPVKAANCIIRLEEGTTKGDGMGAPNSSESI